MGAISEPLVFDVAFINSGGHYDSTTGIYTAPIDGTYEFIAHLWVYDTSSVGMFVVADETRVSVIAVEFFMKNTLIICPFIKLIQHKINS